MQRLESRWSTLAPQALTPPALPTTSRTVAESRVATDDAAFGTPRRLELAMLFGDGGESSSTPETL